MMAGTKIDKRLLGTWQSDRKRTMKGWIWPRGAKAESRRKLARLFGVLTVRYTRHRIHIKLHVNLDSTPYEVLGSDSDSVAILCNDILYDEPRIRHIHFEDDKHYWVAIDGWNREWFKRVSDI
jgi:hypothetical protein